MSQKNVKRARKWLDENIGRECWRPHCLNSLTDLLDKTVADAVHFIHDASVEELAKARVEGAEQERARIVTWLRSHAGEQDNRLADQIEPSVIEEARKMLELRLRSHKVFGVF